MKILKKIILWSVLIIGFLVIYTTFIERNLLIVKKHKVEVSRDKSNNENIGRELKVVQFTDTHLGEYYTLEQLEKVVNKINKLEADIVVFTGDLMDNASTYNNISDISGILGKIECSTGKYAVYGNRDYGGGAVRYYEDIMKEAGFQVLENESISIELEGRNINILGGDDYLMGYHDSVETVKEINEDDVNLLLLHEPDLVDEYKDYPIDLALSGHSHGGQVYIPFYGALKKNVLSEKYNKGFYELNNERETKLYVNSGIGNTKVPFRLFNIPQISLFTIR
ncbi:MAG: metallophosphoesterase [Clostridium sp.]